MKWPWWLHWRNPGIDRQGRWRILADRDPDPARCIPPGLDVAAASRGLELVLQAFEVPASQRDCLRLDDELLALYHSIHPQGWPDCLEFPWLVLLVEQTIGRPLVEAEKTGLRTVGDVQRLVSEPCSSPFTDKGRTADVMIPRNAFP